MKNIVLSLCAFFIAFSIFASGQAKNEKSGGYSRVYSLGINPFVTDPELIKYNPSYLLKYSDMMWADLGTSKGDQFAAVNLSVDNDLVFGIMLSRQLTPGIMEGISSLSTTNSYISLLNSSLTSTASRVIALDNNFEIMGAIRLPKALLGLGISYAGSNNVADNGTTKQTGSAYQFGVNAGILTQFVHSITLDAGFQYVACGATYEPPNKTTNSEISAGSFGGYAKVQFPIKHQISAIPMAAVSVKWGTIDQPYSSGSSVVALSYDAPSVLSTNIGFGIKYETESFLFVGGPSMAYKTVKYPRVDKLGMNEETLSNFSFPQWNFGAEWYPAEWLIARLGYFSSTWSQSDETKFSGGTTTKIDYTMYDLNTGATLGLGFRFGRFSLDAVIQADVLRAGLKNLGNSSGNTFTTLSTSYAF